MGHSQAEKAQSRDRILRQAADQVRMEGLESISVSKLMRSAGLTHGGFYNHFESRSHLLAEALTRALTDSARAAGAGGGEDKAPPRFERRVRNYLSRTHRDARASGCAIAALASDLARAEEPLRAVMSAEVDAFIAQTAQALDSHDAADAMLAVSAMVGALLLSRVHVDPKKSDALLVNVRERLLALNAGKTA